jgi:AcrR family transcriptional regulator
MPPRAGLSEAVILDAAADVADQEGLEAVSLARLSERLHVQAPSLYNHVSGLDGVRRGLAALGAEQLAGKLTRAAVGKSGERAVYAIADAYREFAKSRPGLYAAILRAPQATEARYHAAADVILDVTGASLEPLGLRGDALVDAIRGLRSLVHGFVSLEVSGGFGMPQDVDRSLRRVLGTYLRGLDRSRGRSS